MEGQPTSTNKCELEGLDRFGTSFLWISAQHEDLVDRIALPCIRLQQLHATCYLLWFP